MGFIVLGGISVSLVYYMFQRRTPSLHEALSAYEKSQAVSAERSFSRGPLTIDSGPRHIRITVESGFPPVAVYWSEEPSGRQRPIDLPAMGTCSDLTIHGADPRWLVLFDFQMVFNIKRFDSVVLTPQAYVFEGNINEAMEGFALAVARRCYQANPRALAFAGFTAEGEAGANARGIVAEHYPMSTPENRCDFLEATKKFKLNRRLVLAEEVGYPLLDLLLPLVHENHAQATEAAEYLVANFGEEPAVKTMFRDILSDEDVVGGVLMAGVTWAGLHGGLRDAGCLVANLMARRDLFLSLSAVQTLGLLGHQVAQPLLLALLEGQTGDDLVPIIDALGSCGAREAVEPLLALKADGTTAQGRAAERAIAAIQGRLGRVDGGWLSLSKADQRGQLSAIDPIQAGA